MPDELDDLARHLRENPVDHAKSKPLEALLPKRCEHLYARYDAASNRLWCPQCCDEV